MASSSDNMANYLRGMVKFEMQIKRPQMGRAMKSFAIDALGDAVEHWEENSSIVAIPNETGDYDYEEVTPNMTGNLEASYASAVYYNGRLVEMFDAREVGVEPALDTYGVVGKYRSTRGYPSKHMIRQYRNKKYSFQPVEPTGYGARDSYNFLNGYKAIRKGWEVVVVVGASYAGYLENVRGLDVLMKSYQGFKSEGSMIFMKRYR